MFNGLFFSCAGAGDLKRIQQFIRVVAVLLAVSVISGTGGYGAEENLDQLIRQRNQERQRLSNEREAALQRIQDAEKRTRRVLEVLRVLSTNIEASRKKLAQLKQQISRLKTEIENTAQTISKLQLKIRKDKDEIKRQLLALFYLGKVREKTHFIGLNSFEHYFRNRRLLQYSTQIDFALLERLNINLTKLRAEKDRLENQRLERDRLTQEEEGVKQLLEFERQQQATYLDHLSTDRAAHVRYLRDVQVALEKLNDSLYALATKKENLKKSRQFQGFRSKKRKLPSPVSGRIIHRFGQKQSPYFTLFRRGVLINTRADAPVQCILGGKVVWAGPFRGYQNLVIVDHGKGSLSVYGNLGELYVLLDDVIDQGYTIGNVGRDEIEDRYLFYFEMRYNKRAVNPERWLEKPQWSN